MVGPICHLNNISEIFCQQKKEPKKSQKKIQFPRREDPAARLGPAPAAEVLKVYGYVQPRPPSAGAPRELAQDLATYPCHMILFHHYLGYENWLS